MDPKLENKKLPYMIICKRLHSILTFIISNLNEGFHKDEDSNSETLGMLFDVNHSPNQVVM